MYNKRIIKSFIINEIGEPIKLVPETPSDFLEDEIPREQVIRKIFQDTLAGRQKVEHLVKEARQKAEQVRQEAEKQRKDILKSAEEEKQRILAQAQVEAKSIVEKAKAEAAELVQKAEEEVENIKNKAFNEGFEAGRAEGLKEGIEELSDLRFLVETIIDRLNESKKEYFERITEEILNLVFEIARKVINKEMTENKEFVLQNIKKALSRISGQDSIKIHINPDEYDLVEEHREQLEALFKHSTNIELVKDKNLEKGDCVIETKYGYVDARIESQLDSIKQELTKEL